MTDYLFVTGSEHEPEAVQPSSPYGWSCSKTTALGDSILVYVVGQGIAFEWRAVSDAVRDPRWRFSCDVEHVKDISPIITIQELRAAFPRSQWAPPHTNFRGMRSVQLPQNIAVGIRALRGGVPSTEAFEAQFLRAVIAARADSAAERQARIAVAPAQPQTTTVTATAFLRNADVAAEVLTRANCYCEACRAPAPFFRASDGTPFLEVHHRIRLADGGADTTENAVAVCPNCHRREHFGPPSLHRV